MEAGSGAHIRLSGRGQLPRTDRRIIFLSGPFRAVMDATELALGLVSGCRLKQQVYSSCLLLSGFLDKIKHSLGPLPRNLPSSLSSTKQQQYSSANISSVVNISSVINQAAAAEKKGSTFLQSLTQRRGWRSTGDPGSGRSSDGGGEASATLGGGSARVG
ncbi:hypothetical protein VPH35_081238 [Triticum aestivum]